MKKKSKKIKIFSIRTAIVLVIILLIALFLYFENNIISVSNYTYESELVPESFDNFKIVQVSDLHNKKFKKESEYLFEKVSAENPDIIVMTGDLVSYYDKSFNNAILAAERMSEIAPTYYVTGNHEMWGEYFAFIDALEATDVTVLENAKTEIKIGDDKINLYGLSYEVFCYPHGVTDRLNEMVTDSDDLNILLAHRPDLLEVYANYDVDLVFSGHAHGGQVRLPFTEGVYAPDQGLLPKLTEGIHTADNTTMVISRGLGNSHHVPRIFNKPEIVTLTLETKED